MSWEYNTEMNSASSCAYIYIFVSWSFAASLLTEKYHLSIHIHHVLFSCPQGSWSLVKYIFEADSPKHKLLSDFSLGPFGNHSDLFQLQGIINTSERTFTNLLGWTYQRANTHFNVSFAPTKMTISWAQLAVSWTQTRMAWALGEGEATHWRWRHIHWRWPSLSGNHAWRRVCPKEVEESEWTFGLFSVAKLALSFQNCCKHSSPWNSLCPTREFSLLKETTQGLRVWMWHAMDTDIGVTGASQTSGTSASVFPAPQTALKNWLQNRRLFIFCP